jgi:hypothetical protein
MCWSCENPTKSREDYLREVVHPIVERCGWMVQAVGGSRVHAPFAYTVGLSAQGLPELLVTGQRDERAARLLNAVATRVLDGDLLIPGEGYHLPQSGPCMEVVALAQPDAHLLVAVDVYGPNVEAVQLVWADDRGRWPWERGFRSARGGQPVLGPRGPVVQI